MPAEYRARIEANKPRLYAMAQQQYGVKLNQGPFSIDSRPALIGAKHAEEKGLGKQYHHAVMVAYWIDAQDISDLAILADIAERIGLSRQEFVAALADPNLDDLVQADIDQAQAFGLSGVPAIVFEEKYLIPGAQPYEALAQATEQVQAELASAPA